MAALDKFLQLWYWIFNTPYYQVMIVKDMEKIKTIIQKVSSTEQGKDIAIIDRALKCAWWLIPEVCFRDGKKFLMTVDIENAVPLVEDIKIITEGDLFIKEISITRLTKAPLKYGEIEKSGKPKKFVEVYFPPTLLFEKMKGHFVRQTLAEPESPWAEKKWAIIGVGVCVVIIVFLVLQSGILNRVGGI
jgi:hypothetical protein